MTLANYWETGDLEVRFSKHHQHRHLDVEIRILYPSDGGPLFRVIYGAGYGNEKTDIEIQTQGSWRRTSRKLADDLMDAIDENYSRRNHYFVGAALNDVLDTTKFQDSGTVDVRPEDTCPVCEFPLPLFRGDIVRALDFHMIYKQDEAHRTARRELVDDPSERLPEDALEQICDLCGEDVPYRHTLARKSDLPQPVEDVTRICHGCQSALDAVDKSDCLWCGTTDAVEVVLLEKDVPKTVDIGYLCLDCLS